MKLTHLSRAIDIPIPRWVLPHWVREKTLTMISAPGGVGKSNFATAMGLSVAAGKGFLGQPEPSAPGRVVYIAIDAASWDHAHVARRLAPGLGVPSHMLEDDEPDDWTAGFWFSFEPFFLESDPKGFEALMNAAAWGPDGEVMPDLVVIDSLRNVHDGDENDAKAMMQVMRFFRRWSEKNCSILLLHHSKKPNEFTSPSGWDSARGSGVIHNSVDAHIVLKKEEAKIPKLNTQILTATWVKGRGGDDTPTVKYRVVWSRDRMDLSLVRRGRPKKVESVAAQAASLKDNGE